MNNDNFNPYFSYIPMVDTDGNNYNILVNSKKTNDLLPFISVKSYGAKGDGVTDDTNAIKSALNDLVPAVGGTIYFPTGTYIISETILIGGNVTIYGDGVFNSLIKLADNSNCNIISNDENTIMYYIKIHDIGLDGNAKIIHQVQVYCYIMLVILKSITLELLILKMTVYILLLIIIH